MIDKTSIDGKFGNEQIKVGNSEANIAYESHKKGYFGMIGKYAITFVAVPMLIATIAGCHLLRGYELNTPLEKFFMDSPLNRMLLEKQKKEESESKQEKATKEYQAPKYQIKER